MILKTILGYFLGPVVEKVTDLFKVFQQRQMTEAEVRAEVEKELAKVLGTITVTQGDIIKHELQAEDLLTRIWRPIVALLSMFILVFYALILPIMVDWFGFPPVRVGDLILSWMFTITLTCLGGYVAGRSVEKIVDKITVGRR